MSTFKIVKIIDEHQIAVNAGAGKVKKGDILEIFEKGIEVIDPDTGINLGTLDLTKASVIVTTVLQNMCICKSNDYEHNLFGYGIAFLSPMGKPIIKPLKVDEREITSSFKDVDKTIRIGDLVRTEE